MENLINYDLLYPFLWEHAGPDIIEHLKSHSGNNGLDESIVNVAEICFAFGVKAMADYAQIVLANISEESPLHMQQGPHQI